MKNLISTFFLFLFAVSINAQNGKKDQMTTDQIADLQTKRMDLNLDLTKEQRSQIFKINKEIVENHRAKFKMHKKLKESKKKLTANERYKLQSKRLDKKIARKKQMSAILTEKQMQKFIKMKTHHKRERKGKKKAYYAKRKVSFPDEK